MDWVDRPKNCKGLYWILQGSHLDNFSLKTLKLDWVAFHSATFQLRCLDFQSNQYKKLVPFLSRFCNGLFLWFEERFIAAKLLLRSGLVWTVGLTVEIKLRFKFPRRSEDEAKKSCD